MVLSLGCSLIRYGYGHTDTLLIERLIWILPFLETKRDKVYYATCEHAVVCWHLTFTINTTPSSDSKYVCYPPL